MDIIKALFRDPAFAQAVWQAIFQLLTLSIVGCFGTLTYQRIKRRNDARQELIDEIDQFSVDLYRPRKMYQLTLDRENSPLSAIRDPDELRLRRAEALLSSLGEFVGVVGRFRALQVKMVALYGYDNDLFAHYLAIWWYLKAVRVRMQAGQDLFFHHEDSRRVDAFYRLIDSYRYRIAVARFARRPPPLARPPREILETMYTLSDAIYTEAFGQPPARTDSHATPPGGGPSAGRISPE